MDAKSVLMAVSACVVMLLGLAHLLFTFYGPKLLPRDPALIDSMKSASLVISKETTVWKAWIGFNASHSMAAILFGLIFGYLALLQPDVLYGSVYLQSVGFGMLVGFLLLARAYWFSAPFWGITTALICYIASLFLAHS
ncbi:MAG: LIC_13387 family protein [Oceanococcus sp.]